MKRALCLNNKAKIVFLEHVANYLRCDRVGDELVNEFKSLNSILISFSDDLMHNGLLIMISKLGGEPFLLFFLFKSVTPLILATVNFLRQVLDWI